MQLLECIRDNGYSAEHMMFIDNYPVKGEPYTLRKRVHTSHGVGYLLEEITNPIMPNGEEPNFHSSRFKRLDDISGDSLELKIEESIECK